MNYPHVMTHAKVFTEKPMLSTMKTGRLNYKVTILSFPAALIARWKSWEGGAIPRRDTKKNSENNLNVEEE